MSIIESKIDPRSESFAANDKAMRAQIDELHANSTRVAEGGGARYAERHKKRGKLLARERIARLVDPGAPFLEIGQFAAWEKRSVATANPSLGKWIAHCDQIE